MSIVPFEFPETIRRLPLADVPLEGCTAYLVQGEHEQVLFMRFDQDVDLPEHSHEAQWGIVLAGRIELTIEGVRWEYHRGDHYYLPAGIKHAGKIHAGYADITFFDQKERYPRKESSSFQTASSPTRLK